MPRRPNRWIARYNGSCGLCEGRIERGADWITRYLGQNVHILCAQKDLLRRAQEQVNLQTKPQGGVPDVLRGLVRGQD